MTIHMRNTEGSRYYRLHLETEVVETISILSGTITREKNLGRMIRLMRSPRYRDITGEDYRASLLYVSIRQRRAGHRPDLAPETCCSSLVSPSF